MIWTPKVDGVDRIRAAHINALQTEKLDRDGDIPLTGDLDAGVHDISAGSFSIGVNKLEAAEFAHLDGQDQAVKTTSNPKFSGMFGSQVMVGGPAAFGAGLLHNGENPVLPLAMEESLLFDGDRLDAWYRNTSDSKIYYTYSDDPMAEVWSTPLDISTGTDLGGMNFPYVFQVGATYYMAGVVDHGGGFGNALYLWESTDKITWTFANSGAPILQHSANGADWWYTIYNPAIVVIGGTWHLLIEGKTSTSSFQTGYSYSTLADGPNFDTHLSAAPVLPGYTGNPHLVSVPDRSAILAIYGDVSEGTWTLRAASCLLASDPGDPASWTVAPGFGYQVSGVHIADPCIVFAETADKPWAALLGYNYAQTDGYHALVNVGLNDFYDLVTAPLTTAAGKVSMVGVLEVDAINLGHYGKAQLGINAAGELILLPPCSIGTPHFRSTTGNGLGINISAQAGVASGDTNGGDVVIEAGMRYGGSGVAGDIEFWVGTGSTTYKLAAFIQGDSGNVILSNTGALGAYKGNVGIQQTTFGTNAEGTLAMGITPHVPDDSPVDCFQLYATDVVGGNCAPHFRTENGRIVKLYQVVDAAIDDAINAAAWDATTAGVLTAIRDALVARGDLAAA